MNDYSGRVARVLQAHRLNGRHVSTPEPVDGTNVVLFPQYIDSAGSHPRHKQVGPHALPCCGALTTVWWDVITETTQHEVGCPACGHAHIILREGAS